MANLCFKKLGKKYGKRWAVRDLDLTLNPGEIFVLLGPNGAGKTTTLKLAAGLLHPDQGEVLIKNINIQSEPMPAKRYIGYVPDEPFIYNKLTGREFINFVSGIYQVKIREYKKRLNNYLELFEIGDWIDEFAETYSHGMKQKIIMCQLLMHDPEIILIDEPLVGLDPKSSKTVREVFQEQKCHNKTLMICTHTLSFAQEIATRIGIINHGTLKFAGTLDELSRIAGKKNIEDIYIELSESVFRDQ
jgi:ABC-2 type transport system ATP-binding protein